MDKKGTLASWGASDNLKTKAGQLTVLKANHVEIPVASQFDCLKSDRIFRNLTSEMTFCAGKLIRISVHFLIFKSMTLGGRQHNIHMSYKEV